MSISLSNFKIQKVLHEGIHTQIIKGQDLINDRAVILKIVRPEFVNESTIERLQNEFKLLSTVNSDCIIKPISFSSTSAGTFLVLENYESRNLMDYITEEPWDLQERLDIAIQITHALGLLHHANIIHKDIKPHNILVNSKNEVKVIDLSSGTSLPREAPQEISITKLEGTLAYISPEQTARMARMIDYRTDIYSLGVTLYHLFTGKVPFSAETPLELIHMHITQLPIPPIMINPEIPQPLSDIILKCMKKNVEERYKSTFGLLFDLEKCLDSLREKGRVEPFPPGERDFFDRFHTPQKIYGREKEIAIVNECVEKVWKGDLVLLEITGYSGIGKSSLVLEAMKGAVQRHGRFVKYKFDQFNRNVPNDAIASIIKSLVHQMLAQSSDHLNAWKNAILDAVGKNGQILVDLVNDIKLVIGEQPPLEQLSQIESENRFNYVMNEFFKILPRPESPLIIMFDDCQWIDEASIKLLRYLLFNSSIKHLLFIMAYRDNEVTEMHTLKLLLKELSSSNLSIIHLAIPPLEESAVSEILNEVFYPLSKTDLKYLTRIVEEKTMGIHFSSFNSLNTSTIKN